MAAPDPGPDRGRKPDRPGQPGQPGGLGDDLETWASLATVLEWLPAALDAQLQRDSDLTHFEYGVLFALADAAGHTLRMSTLAGYSNSSLSRLSRAVARLEARNWVTREPDPGDGRYTLAILTGDGRAKVEQAGPGHEELVRRLVLEPLTRAQVRQLRDITRRILTAIRSEEGWRPSTGSADGRRLTDGAGTRPPAAPG